MADGDRMVTTCRGPIGTNEAHDLVLADKKGSSPGCPLTSGGAKGSPALPHVPRPHFHDLQLRQGLSRTHLNEFTPSNTLAWQATLIVSQRQWALAEMLEDRRSVVQGGDCSSRQGGPASHEAERKCRFEGSSVTRRHSRELITGCHLTLGLGGGRFLLVLLLLRMAGCGEGENAGAGFARQASDVEAGSNTSLSLATWRQRRCPGSTPTCSVRELQILIAQQPRMGVLSCDHSNQ